MVPFLAHELHTVLQAILSKFVKPAVMEEATSVARLAKIDGLKKDNVVHPKECEIGIVAKMVIQKAEESKSVIPLELLEFQDDCVVLLQK